MANGDMIILVKWVETWKYMYNVRNVLHPRRKMLISGWLPEREFLSS